MSWSADLLRLFRKSPTFALIAVSSLAVGIGSFVAAAAYMEGVRWRALPYPNASQLVVLEDQRPSPGRVNAARVDALDGWTSRHDVLSSTASITGALSTLHVGDNARLVRGAAVSAEYFRMLGVPMLLGRPLQPSDERPGAPPVAVIGEALWRSAFNADSAIIGQPLSLEADRPVVVGVVAGTFEPPFNRPEYWLPLMPLIRAEQAKAVRAQMTGTAAGAAAELRVDVIARLRDGASINQAATVLRGATPAAAAGATTVSGSAGFWIRPLRAAMADSDAQDLSFALIACCVLLIACANVGCLFFIRQLSRAGDIAVRVALGASTTRVAREVVLEALGLVAVAAVLGAALAAALVEQLRRTPLLVDSLPPQLQPRLDWMTYAVLVATAVVCAAVISLLPLREILRPSLFRSLLPARGLTMSRSHARLYRALIGFELAGAATLAGIAAVAVASYSQLAHIDLGFNPRGLLSIMVVPRADPRTPLDEASLQAIVQTTRDRIGSVQGITSVAAWGIPKLQLAGGRVQEAIPVAFDRGAPGATHAEPNTGQATVQMVVAADTSLMRTLDVPLVQGRNFGRNDAVGTEPVAILDAYTARRWWPAGSPVGQRIRIGGDDQPWRTVVGVVGATRGLFRDDVLRGQPATIVFLPMTQTPIYRYALFYARYAGLSTDQIQSALRSSVQAQFSGVTPDVGPAVPMYDRALAQMSIGMSFTTALALLGLVLGAIGLYGAVSYAMTQRTHEFGVRLALGAEPRDLIRLALGEAAISVFGGLLLGALLFRAAKHGLQAAFLGINSPATPLFMLGAVVLFLITVAIAVYLPVRRVGALDPMRVLRVD